MRARRSNRVIQTGLLSLFLLSSRGPVLAAGVGSSKSAQIGPGQQATIVDADSYLQEYVDLARTSPAMERTALYAKHVYEPLLKRCREGGGYYEFGKYQLIRPITDLDALTNELAALKRAQLFTGIESALRKSATLLPGPKYHSLRGCCRSGHWLHTYRPAWRRGLHLRNRKDFAPDRTGC